MKSKLLNAGLILTSFVGYLEWGQGNSTFLIQEELDILVKLFTDPSSVIHPLILLPLAGQILLLITLFQKQPNRLMTFLGLGGIGLLLLLMFFIGIISSNVKILLSTVPFLLVAILLIRYHLLNKSKTPE